MRFLIPKPLSESEYNQILNKQQQSERANYYNTRGVESVSIPDIKKDPMKEIADRCLAEANLLFPDKHKKKKDNGSSTHKKTGRNSDQ